MPDKEATARIKINRLLEAAGWRFFAEGAEPANILLESGVTVTSSALDALGENFERSSRGYVDFLLLDAKGFPLLVLEAKAEHMSPLVGKEQARRYAIHPDWPMVELGEVCKAIVTGPFGSALHQSDYVDDGIPVINPQNIVDGTISIEGVKMVAPATRDRLKEFTVRVDDIVIGRRGEMGRCGVVTSGMNGWLCGTGSFVIRLKDECLARFAFFQIASPKVKQYLEEQAIGVTMKNLNQGILSSIQIPLPPLAIQQAIVAEIEGEQTLVAANRELIARFEQKIQATLARVWGENTVKTFGEDA